MGDALDFRYDMGDFLEHAFVVDKVLSGTSSAPSAASLAPVRLRQGIAGWVTGYAGLLEALVDPNHAEHDDLGEWVGEDFEPEAFDLKAVNLASPG